MLGDSKTNRAIAFGMGISLILILVGIGIEVAFDKSVIEYVLAGLGKIGFDTGVSTYRNVKTDTPVRLQEAAVTQAIRASEAGVSAPTVPALQGPPIGLQTWQPQEVRHDAS
jgi:hypothetical protein